MTDRAKAIAALKKAGAFCNYMDSSFSEYVLPNKASVVIRENGDVEIRTKCQYLPSLLSGLTLEDVERACEAAFKALPSTTDPSHFAAIRAYWLDVMDRLRQQVNGDTCNREGD